MLMTESAAVHPLLPDAPYRPAQRPTMYFIGVTTHKIDLLTACRDQFDRLDAFAELLGEVSSISKEGSQLVGHAEDPITSGLVLDAFLPAGHWQRTGAEALVLGAGGSALAVTWDILQPERGADRPTRIIVTNRSLPRLEEIRRFHTRIGAGVPIEYHQFFMTKGHYHTVVQTGKVYLCLRGQGLMLMKLGDGCCCWEPFSPGQLVYVPPYWAHRSVNTGDEPLISLCLYPGDAGHNYGDIQTDGFPRRVFLRQGQVVIE